MDSAPRTFGSVERPKLLRDQVYDLLRERLLAGAGDGFRLVEEELAEQMNVSRTPVREALRRLEIEGLIRPAGSRGFEAAYSQFKDVIDALDVRLLLEMYAAKEAAKYITEEELNMLQNLCQAENSILQKKWPGGRTDLFEINQRIHQTIVRAARNKTLINLLNSVPNHSAYRLYAVGDKKSSIQFHEGHERLVEALRTRNEENITAEVANHILLMKSILSTEKAGEV